MASPDASESDATFSAFDSRRDLRVSLMPSSAEKDDAPPAVSTRSKHELHRAHEADHASAAMASYESLDYDVNDNELYQDYILRRTRKNRRNIAAGRWLLTALIAVLTAITAFFIDSIISLFDQLKYRWTFGVYDSANMSFQFAPFAVYVAFNTVLVLIATLLTSLVEPVAGGSGIPEIKCYLNGVQVPRVVRIKTLVVKVLGVLFSVSGGLEIGKEGPMIHSGAIIAAGMSQGKSTSLKFDVCKCLSPYRLDHEKRDFVSAGAAAGVSAAFGAPIGGVLFALEEGASFWNQQLTWRAFFGSMLSGFTLNFLLSGRESPSNWGVLNSPGLVDFGVFRSTDNWIVWELPFFILLGIFGGLFGAVFNGLNTKLTVWRIKKLNHRKGLRVLEAVLVGFVTASVGSALPFLVRECKPLAGATNLERQLDRSYYCPDGYYNDMASLFFTTLEKSIKNLFHSSGAFSVGSLTVFFIFFFFIACWTYGIAVPSGLFVPSFLAGASYGRILGHLVHSWFPNSHVVPGTYALIGAASMLSGMARMTISLTVIIIEATDDISFGMPIMITIMAAKIVGDVFNLGLYDIHIELKHVPFLEWEHPPGMESMRARHFMKRGLKVLRNIERVGNIVQLLRTTRHNGFPVIDSGKDGQNQTFVGMILRSELCFLLKRRVFSDPSDIRRTYDKVTYVDFQNAYPTWPQIDHIVISPAEEDCLMDLRPFMNACAYSIPPQTPLRRAFTLFRSLGLRHLAVVDQRHFIIGIITRKDLTHHSLDEVFHERARRKVARIAVVLDPHTSSGDTGDDHDDTSFSSSSPPSSLHMPSYEPPKSAAPPTTEQSTL